MKKRLSFLLALTMILSLFPTASFATEAEAPAVETAIEEITETPKPHKAEEIVETVKIDIPEVAVLDAANPVTVSGTLNLPDATMNDGSAYLYFYTPAVLDENGKVLKEASSVRGQNVNFTKGSRSAYFTVNDVPAGDYFIGVRIYRLTSSAASGNVYYYFNADGSLAANEYCATTRSFNSNVSGLNLTIPAAETTISGTINFNSPITTDTELNLYLSGEQYCYTYIPVAAGTRSVNYKVGLPADTYSLELSLDSTGNEGYCDVYGGLSNNYNDRIYYSTLDGSISNLNIDASSLLGDVMEDGSNSEVKFTITLSEATSEFREFCVAAATEWEDEYYTSSYFPVEANSRTITGSLWVPEGERFTLAYGDSTNANSWYYAPTGMRFYCEDGVTGLLDNATFYEGGEIDHITLTEPAGYKVTGTLTRSETSHEATAFAFANFQNGESFANIVYFAEGVSTANYAIYVPQRLDGQRFISAAAESREGDSNLAEMTTLVTGSSYTLSGNTAVDPMEVYIVNEPNITGTLSLPDGVVAPEGGLVITLGLVEEYDWIRQAIYYMPEGESSLEYGLFGDISSEFAVFTQMDRYHEQFINDSVPTYFSPADANSADVVLPEAVYITGTLTVPESCREGVSTHRFYAQTNDNSYQGYVSVMAGETTASYRIRFPMGQTMTRMYGRVYADSLGKLFDGNQYLQADGSVGSQNNNISLVVNGPMTVDFAFPTGKSVSGTVTVPEGLPSGYYRGYVYLQPTTGGRNYSAEIEFTGTQGNYRITLPADATGTYTLRIYMYDDCPAGVMTYEDFYYAGEGVAPTTDESQAAVITLGEEGAVANISVPMAKIIKGKLMSADGDAIQWNPEYTTYMYLYSAAGAESGTIYLRDVEVDEQGNFTAACDPTITGEYTVAFRVNGDEGSNIVNDYYYYTGTTEFSTDSDTAKAITLTEDHYSGLNIYVNTGWVISGSILMPEGGYFLPESEWSQQTTTIWFNANGEGNYGSGRGQFGQYGGSYSIVVPKVEDTYSIYMNNTTINDGFDTNLCFMSQTAENVAVSGNTVGPDFSPEVAKAIITGTVYRPEGVTDYIGISIYVATAGEYWWDTTNYYGNCYIQNNRDSATFSIPIPASNTSESYKLYYYVNSNIDGVLARKNIYLTADGGMTTIESSAGNFTFDQVNHSFTLLSATPYATGKIFLPDDMTESTNIYVTSSVQTLARGGYEEPEASLWVDPDNAAVDSVTGRRYITYTLTDPSLTPGSTYRLCYYFDYDEEYFDSSDWHYLTEDGESVNYNDATIFTVREDSPNVVDFTPITWDDGSENYIFQSKHGISTQNHAEYTTYSIVYPGASSLTVTFSDRTDAELTLNNGDVYYRDYIYVYDIPGDTLTVDMRLYSGSKFGFAVESIVPIYDTVAAPEEPFAAAIYSESGSSEQAVLNDLANGSEVSITLVSPVDSHTEDLLGALYDGDGRLMDVTMMPVTFTGSTATAKLSFDKYHNAASFKLFMLDDEHAPLMQHIEFGE